jgi:hypothetical protein
LFFFFLRLFFSLSVCFSCSLFDYPPSLPVDFLVLHFFSYSFSVSFFSLFLDFVRFIIVT